MSFIKKFTGFILVILIALLSFSIVSNYTRLSKAGNTIEEARSKVEKLQQEQMTLEKQIAETESQQFIERQLRDKLGLAKEGEVVIVLPDENELRKLAPPKIPKEEYIQEKNWKKWEKLFF